MKLRDVFTGMPSHIANVGTLYWRECLVFWRCRCSPCYWETQTWPAFMSSAGPFVSDCYFPEQE